ncbi:MAG: DUF3368 domain-containing protein [Planctomycetota bacterium]
MLDGDDRRIVVVNTTPIITLALLNRLDLLRDLYGSVHIPPAVYDEVLAGGPDRPGGSQLHAAPWIKRTQLQDPRRADLISDLDRGEAEVIALAQETAAALVIIDERLGRRHAKRLGLSITGTLGVLLRAKSEGILPKVAPLIETLQQDGIRLGQGLVDRALERAEETPSLETKEPSR